MRKRRLWAALITVGLLAAGTPATAQPGTGGPPPERGVAPAGLRAITLITGDRVFVDQQGVPAHTEAAPERVGTVFRRWTSNGNHYVLPADAEPLLDSGRLDRRLFNITALLDFGYDDAQRADLPLLLANGSARSAAVLPSGSSRTRDLPALGLTAISTPKSGATTAWNQLRDKGSSRVAAGVDKIWLNGKMKYTLDKSVPLTGAPAAWQAGHSAKGVKVAVLDSGYDQNHPDLKDVVKASKDFSGSPGGVQDLLGHGTHVASIVAGSGAASTGKYTGVAKDATLVFGKVGDFSPMDDAILAGMEWAAVEQGARVVNMSFGRPGDELSPIVPALERLTAERGTLFVVAAGNEGREQAVGTPAIADSALAVGSTTKTQPVTPSPFSSQGPRLGDYAIKPDIAGPGSDIVAAKLNGAAAGQPYVEKSGTSMAAPHLTGAAAIVAGQHPDWTPAQLKAALMSSANPLAGPSVYQQGTGLVDLARATRQHVHAEQGSLSLGYFRWPHQNQQPATKDMTYRNDTDRPVTLRLALSVQDKTGKPAPAGQFSLSADTVMVPAKGSAKVAVTVDPNKGLGLFNGWLTATEGDTVVRTAIGSYVEEEKYDLKIKNTGRDGKPAQPEVTVTGLRDTVSETVRIGQDGLGSLRVPAGDYQVTSTLLEYGPRGEDRADPVAIVQLAAPSLKVDRDLTVDADARKAKRQEVTLDDPSLRIVRKDLAVLHGKNDDRDPCCTPQQLSVSADADSPVYLGSLGGSAPAFRHVTQVSAVQPAISARIVAPRPTQLDIRHEQASPPLLGDHQLAVVDGKRGRPEDLAGLDVRGKLVLLTLDRTDRSDERVAAVAEAGAKAALLVTPFRRLLGPVTIPVLSAAQHRLTTLVELLGSGPVTVATHGIAASPVSYDLALTERERLPDIARHQVRKENLAKVESSYHADAGHPVVRPHQRPGLDGPAAVTAFPEFHPFRAPPPPVATPTKRTEYLSPGWWTRTVETHDPASPILGSVNEQVEQGSSRYEVGKVQQRHWNAGMVAPSLRRAAPNRGPAAYRGEEYLSVQLPLFSPRPASRQSPPSFGYLDLDGETTLAKDGKVVGTSTVAGFGGWKVPDEPGRYELSTKVKRPAPAVLSTEIEASWAFRSARGPAGQPVVLPLLGVDFDLPLDELKAAPAGLPLPLSLDVYRQDGPAKVQRVALAISFDDGAAWKSVPVHQVGDRWLALLPRGGKPGGFASLRVSAEDRDGNTIRQTVLRGYALK